jgi:BirA family biotin operon repressor/biotin-[acetyl-CoA-carboxylase] ligase
VAGVEHHGEIDSTQTRAQSIASQLPADGLPYLIVADQQTAGRGRGENHWWTGPGSLALSLVFDPETYGLERPARPSRSLAAGVALVDAVAPLLADDNIGLHWPNDVFVEQRKLAGILIDVLPSDRHILGLGLNTNNTLGGAPPDVRARAVSLCELLGRELDHTLLLTSFCEHLDAALRLSVQDPQALGRRFQQLCLQVGRELTVESVGASTTGRCLGIATDGALLLDTAAGMQRIYSGQLKRPEMDGNPRK